MGVIGAEGFDSIALADITDYWQAVGANSSIVAGAGRCGSSAFRNTSANGNGPSIGVTTSNAGGYAAWAYNPDAFGVTANFEVQAADSGVLLFARVLTDGSVDIWKGPNTTLGTLLGATPAGLVSTGHFTHIGIEWVFNATTGLVRIWINKPLGGTPDFESTGINTTNTWTSGQWRNIAYLPKGYIDDLYWGDASGAGIDNTFMGDLRVEEQVALTDAVGGGGFYRQWTPSSGSDHGALVDEIPPNDGTDYVASGTIGQIDSFKFPPITPLTGSVYAVLLMPNMVKSVPGGRQVANFVRSGGSDFAGTAQSIAQTTYRYYPQMYALNPNGSVAWTVTSVNAMEGGVKIVA